LTSFVRFAGIKSKFQNHGPAVFPSMASPPSSPKWSARTRICLAHTDVPKLFINGEPGTLVRGRLREIIRQWPNQTEITVKGRKLLQEDSPDEIGAAIAEFVTRVKEH